MLIHKISIYPNAQYKRFSKVTKDKVSPYAPSSGLQVCWGQNFRLFVASGILIKFDILRRPQHLKKISHYIWHYLVTSKKLGDFFKILCYRKVTSKQHCQSSPFTTKMGQIGWIWLSCLADSSKAAPGIYFLTFILAEIHCYLRALKS